MGVGDQRYGPAALSPGKRPGAHFTGDWVSLRVGPEMLRAVQPIANDYTYFAILPFFLDVFKIYFHSHRWYQYFTVLGLRSFVHTPIYV
jgi:hypothetical protein